MTDLAPGNDDAPRPIRILHLEDSYPDACLIEMRLMEGGLDCDIHLVRCREEFEQAIAAPAYDLILCDYSVPGYSGLAALQLAEEKVPEVPVIVISGLLGEEAAVECLREGHATDYLLKDRLERLVPAVQRALVGAEERRKRFQAEAALLASERNYRLLFETLQEGIWTIDRHGFITFVNDPMASMLGYQVGDMLGRHLLSFVGHGCWPAVRAALDRVRFGSREETEVLFTHYEGHGIFTRQWSGPVIDAQGQYDGAIAGVLDITDRKQAETALLESERMVKLEQLRGERRFADLFEFAPSPTIMTSPTGVITLVNRQAESLFGWSRDELVGQSWDVLMPGEPRVDLEALRQSWVDGVPVQLKKPGEAPFMMRRKDGASLPIDLTLGPVEWTDGSMVVATMRDISGQIQADAQIRQSLREKEVLLKEIHHRVKNNLQVISSLLAMRADSASESTAREMLCESQHRVRSMALIHEHFYQSPGLAKVDFGDYLHRLVNSLYRNYSANGEPVKLSMEMDDEVLLNMETAVPLGLIVNELVSNAFKHSFNGHRAGELIVTLRRNGGGSHSLMVADNGPGLPSSLDLAQIESLGLQLVRTLSHQLKAKLTLQRESGAAFRLEFKELVYAERN